MDSHYNGYPLPEDHAEDVLKLEDTRYFRGSAIYSKANQMLPCLLLKLF